MGFIQSIDKKLKIIIIAVAIVFAAIFILIVLGYYFWNVKKEKIDAEEQKKWAEEYLKKADQNKKNDILSSKLDSENPQSGSEDLAQEVKSKEKELMKEFENKLAENFKKPDLISTSEHLEDIELGNYKITFSEEKDESIQSNWNMKVLNGNKVTKTLSSFYFSSPIQVRNGNASLFLFQGFSGGAHCCFSVYPAVYDRQKLRFGNELDLRDIEIDDNNLFEKDGQLYLYAPNPRFAYFYTSFADSGIMFYPSFYRFDPQTVKLVNKNSEFKEYYQIFYKGTDEEISKWREDGKKDVYPDWLPWLTARSVNGLMAGGRMEDVWKKFNDDFDYFVKYHKPKELKDKTADQVKKEIEEILEILR